MYSAIYAHLSQRTDPAVASLAHADRPVTRPPPLRPSPITREPHSEVLELLHLSQHDPAEASIASQAFSISPRPPTYPHWSSTRFRHTQRPTLRGSAGVWTGLIITWRNRPQTRDARPQHPIHICYQPTATSYIPDSVRWPELNSLSSLRKRVSEENPTASPILRLFQMTEQAKTGRA